MNSDQPDNNQSVAEIFVFIACVMTIISVIDDTQRPYTYQLIFWLLMSDISFPLTYIPVIIIRFFNNDYQIGNNNVACIFQGFIICIGLTSTIANVFLTNYAIYYIIQNKQFIKTMYQNIIRFALPLVFSTIICIFGEIGPVPPIRQIECYAKKQEFVFIFEILPMYFLIFLTTFLAYSSNKTLKKYESETLNDKGRLVLYLYPLVLIINWIPIVVLRTIALAGLKVNLGIFPIISFIFVNLSGFLDSLVYGILSHMSMHQKSRTGSIDSEIIETCLEPGNQNLSIEENSQSSQKNLN